jgi:hypothetical protein
MTTIASPGAGVFVERFNVDPEVSNLDRDLKKMERSPQQKYALIAIPVMFAITVASVAAMYLFAPDRSPQFLLLTAVLGGVILTLAGVLGARVVSLTNTPEKVKVNVERKESQQSIKRSINAARTLGDTVPTLTKEHAEAGIRFDKKMYRYRGKWNRDDFHGIRTLLLEDLSREDAIISLVTVRGMVTLSEVREALHEMESNGKPLQGGWL